MTLRTFSASLLLLVSVTGCGKEVIVPQDPQATVTATAITTACTTLYESYAGWTKGCFGTDLGDVESDHLVTSCVERAALPGIDATAEAIEGCGAKIAASSCAALPLECIMSDYLGGSWPSTAAFLLGDDEAAYHLFPNTRGKLAAGLSCDIAAQCQSGTCTTTFSFVYDQGCGVCVDWKNPGEACDATTICGHGSSCADGICKSWGNALGEACEMPKGSSNCQPDLYRPKATCVPRLHVGDACEDSFEQQQACPRGSVCSASVCQLVVEGKAGDACDDVVVGCGSEMFCLEGHCRKPVANVGLGGACNRDVCAPSLRCREGVCAVPAMAGESCYDDTQCAPGLICPTILVQSPRCSPPRAEGEACESTDACAGGLFCDESIPATPLCQRKRASGEACEDHIPCWTQLSCREGVCSDLGVCSAL